MLPADLELVLHAHSDLSWCLEMIAKFRARVAELEAERHITNEALDDAVQALRAQRAADGITQRIAPVQALREDEPAEAPYVSRPLPPRDATCARPECGHSGADHHHGDTKCWANLPRTRQRNGAWNAVAICGCSGFAPESGGAL